MIYGISSKHEFGAWDHRVVTLESDEKAQEYLETEEGDFRTREIVSRSKAISLAGKKAVEEAENLPYWGNDFY